MDLLTCHRTVTVTMNNADCWYLLVYNVITSDKTCCLHLQGSRQEAAANNGTCFYLMLMTCCAYSCTQYGLHTQYIFLTQDGVLLIIIYEKSFMQFIYTFFYPGMVQQVALTFLSSSFGFFVAFCLMVATQIGNVLKF